VRTLQSNTVVVEVETITFHEIVCDLPTGLDVVFDDTDAFIVESEPHDPVARMLKHEQTLRADRALKDGIISVSNGKSDRKVLARLRSTTQGWVVCDVPPHYLIGFDGGRQYLMKKDITEPPPQKWPVTGLLTVEAALASGIIEART